MFKLVSSLFVVLTLSVQIWAQCGGYFKEQSRQVLSNAIGNGYFEDFDNDGKDDLLGYSWTSYRNGGASNFEFHYYKRLSGNSFDTTAKTTVITNVNHSPPFVVGDVNGDGYKDLIIKILVGPQTIRTYLNDGTGSFSPAANEYISNESVYAASDLNGDGKADLIISNPNVNLGYRLTQPDNTYGSVVPITPVTYMQTIRNLYGIGYTLITSLPLMVEDLNGDGLKDIAYVEGVNNGYTLKVLTNSGSLTFSQTASFAFPTVLSKLRAYDLNNDGKKDFVSDFGGLNGTKVAVNNGNNTFTTSTLQFNDTFQNRYGEDFITKRFSVADFDNDGDLDLIYPGATAYRIFRNQGNATFTSELVNAYPGIDHLVDLDNDGRSDAVFLNYSVINGSYRLYDGNNWYYYYLHNAVSFRKNVCNSVGQTKVVDFDGDGYVDRAFWNPQSGTWRYYPSRQFNVQNTFQLGQTGDVPVPNDYDGDNKTDFAVYRPSSGTWHIAGSAGQNVNGFQFGTSGDKPVPADYDGDGKADIAVYRPSNGTWHFWFSGSSQYLAVQFGLSEDKVVPADYDGDGKARHRGLETIDAGLVYLKSSDGSFQAVQYGLSTDKPIPGDYDGDGKANITVYRDGLWYVLRSNYSTSGMYFGIANDATFFNDTLQGPSIGAYRSSNSSFHLSAQTQYAEYAQPTGNSAGEIFVSSVLPR